MYNEGMHTHDTSNQLKVDFLKKHKAKNDLTAGSVSVV
jgi:hypothetical protein